MEEILFGSSDPREAYKISKLLREKKIRKIAPRIYSANFEETPAEIIKRNILVILGNLYPGAVLSHRSAFEFKPTSSNQIFVTYKYTRKVFLPGVTINFLNGKGPVEGDNKLFGELYVSSKERAFLENLQGTGKAGPDSKSLSIPQIEEKLDDILRINGEDGLNNIRNKAGKLSVVLDMPRQFELLNKIITKTPLAISHAAGLPYDKERIKIFEILFDYLHNHEFKNHPENYLIPNSFRNFSFFEAYFSNYIEGALFEVAEAKKIIDSGILMPDRGDDSHDVLGTYRVVSNKNEMKIIPKNGDEFLGLLQSRHKKMLSARVDKHPGEFKSQNNRSGNTSFVDFKLIRGTLTRGFEYYKALTNPFACAAYIMFLVSEVHPFEDGNGRIARIMMNAELFSRSQYKIIIPPVFREDYLLALRKLTNDKAPVLYIEMLTKAHSFSKNLHFENYDDMYNYLNVHNAFYEPNEGKHLIVD